MAFLTHCRSPAARIALSGSRNAFGISRRSLNSPSSLPKLLFWIFGLLGLLITAGGGVPPAKISPDRALEYKVKAAYLFNFTKYVEWPEQAFSSPEAPIIIGVLGVDPFGELLESTIGDRRVGNRNVKVKRSRRVEDLRQAHVVFVSNSEKERWPAILAALKGTNALTVSDIQQFCDNGGMIAFLIENDVVRFDVNSDNAEHAGLKISARMLSTARAVSGKRNQSR